MVFLKKKPLFFRGKGAHFRDLGGILFWKEAKLSF